MSRSPISSLFQHLNGNAVEPVIQLIVTEKAHRLIVQQNVLKTGLSDCLMKNSRIPLNLHIVNQPP